MPDTTQRGFTMSSPRLSFPPVFYQRKQVVSRWERVHSRPLCLECFWKEFSERGWRVFVLFIVNLKKSLVRHCSRIAKVARSLNSAYNRCIWVNKKVFFIYLKFHLKKEDPTSRNGKSRLHLVIILLCENAIHPLFV